jgi:hypothetical protein
MKEEKIYIYIYIYGNTSEGEGVKGETFHLRISSSKFEQFS